MKTMIKLDCVKHANISIGNDVTCHDLIVRINSIPVELNDWLSINPRSANMKSPIIKSIIETIIANPQSLLYLNRGLIFFAEDISFNRRSATLTLSDNELHGIGDGGHTFHAIQRALKLHDVVDDCFIRILLYLNMDKSHVKQTITSINKSVAVDNRSLAEVMDNFKQIKEIVNGEPFADRVVYKANQKTDGAPISVEDIISMIMTFNFDLYPFNSNSPMNTSKAIPYGKNNSHLNYYLNNTYSTRQVEYMKPILHDLFDLWDKIEYIFPTINNKVEKRFATYSWSKYNGTSRETLLYNNHTKFVMPKGIVFPLYNSFKTLVQRDTKGYYSWRINPHTIIEDVLNTMSEFFISEKNIVPHNYGKNKNIYEQYISAIVFDYCM